MKKFKRSSISIACYVFTAIFAAYFLFMIVSTITTINQYYAAYDMQPGFGEVVGYLFQNCTSPLMAMIISFMAGLIYDEVRRLNPANWATDDEITEAKEAKRLAKEAKQIAKGEAAVAAAAAAAENKDTEEVIKPEFAAVVAEEAEEAAALAEEQAEEETEAAEAPAEEEPDEVEEAPAGPVHTEFFAEVAEEDENASEKEPAETEE